MFLGELNYPICSGAHVGIMGPAFPGVHFRTCQPSSVPESVATKKGDGDKVFAL